jgi:hypothetical protein
MGRLTKRIIAHATGHERRRGDLSTGRVSGRDRPPEGTRAAVSRAKPLQTLRLGYSAGVARSSLKYRAKEVLMSRTNSGHKRPNQFFTPIILGAVAVCALASGSAAIADAPRLGVSININIPGHIGFRDRDRYQPYYVGRVFYTPRNEWRMVYAFPVQTDYGVQYEPCVYDNGQLVVRGYVPGPDVGYNAPVVEGRGRWNPQWYRGWAGLQRSNRHDRRYDNGRNDQRYYGNRNDYRNRQHSDNNDRRDRDRDDHHDRDRDRDHDRN